MRVSKVDVLGIVSFDRRILRGISVSARYHQSDASNVRNPSIESHRIPPLFNDFQPQAAPLPARVSPVLTMTNRPIAFNRRGTPRTVIGPDCRINNRMRMIERCSNRRRITLTDYGVIEARSVVMRSLSSAPCVLSSVLCALCSGTALSAEETSYS